jgi:hypothetical protein
MVKNPMVKNPMLKIRKDHFIGSFSFRGWRPPKTSPTSTTTTSKIARAMMPVVSAYIVLLIGVGVSARAGVEIKVDSSVGGGRRETGGGVGVSPGGGKSAIEVDVSGRSLSMDDRSAPRNRSFKTVAACAGVNARKVPTKKVAATRMDNRIMRERGRCGWFIAAQSISRDNYRGELLIARALISQ